MLKLHVELTPNDLLYGKHDCDLDCALGRAIKRALVNRECVIKQKVRVLAPGDGRESREAAHEYVTFNGMRAELPKLAAKLADHWESNGTKIKNHYLEGPVPKPFNFTLTFR